VTADGPGMGMTSNPLYGDITGDRLIIEEGGIYKGKVNMDIISSKNLYEGKFQLVKANQG